MKNKHNQSTSNIHRSDARIDVTGEVFTPMALCHQMVSQIDVTTLSNPDSTFLDPAAGSGNFLIALQMKLSEYHDIDHINNNMLFGIELMSDNHAEMCERLGVSVDHPHFVCANALQYDGSFGSAQGLEQFMV